MLGYLILRGWRGGHDPSHKDSCEALAMVFSDSRNDLKGAGDCQGEESQMKVRVDRELIVSFVTGQLHRVVDELLSLVVIPFLLVLVIHRG